MIMATDLDGTLLDDRKQVGEQEKQWLIQFLQKGNVLAFLTSRNQADVKKCAPWIFDQRGCRRYIGFDEGARVLLPNDQLVDMPDMSFSDVMKIIENVCEKTKGFTALYKGGHYDVVFSRSKLIELKLKGLLKRETINRYFFWEDFKLKKNERFWKVKLGIDTSNCFSLYEELIEKLPQYCVTLNEGRIEIMAGLSGKLGALTFICEKEDARLADVLYFGDEGNDLYCLKATNSYAMGNAPDWIKRSAKNVTNDDNNQHGVLKVLKSLNI